MWAFSIRYLYKNVNNQKTKNVFLVKRIKHFSNVFRIRCIRYTTLQLSAYITGTWYKKWNMFVFSSIDCRSARERVFEHNTLRWRDDRAGDAVGKYCDSTRDSNERAWRNFRRFKCKTPVQIFSPRHALDGQTQQLHPTAAVRIRFTRAHHLHRNQAGRSNETRVLRNGIITRQRRRSILWYSSVRRIQSEILERATSLIFEKGEQKKKKCL